MVDGVIRVEDEAKWPHIYSVGKARFRTKEPFSLDINPDFALDENQLLVEDEVAVKKQILNILGTPIGTEDFMPRYGSNLPYRLFDFINEITAHLMYLDTVAALETWMANRIRLLTPGTDIIPTLDEDGYTINLSYVILTNRVTTQFQFEMLR